MVIPHFMFTKNTIIILIEKFTKKKTNIDKNIVLGKLI